MKNVIELDEKIAVIAKEAEMTSCVTDNYVELRTHDERIRVYVMPEDWTEQGPIYEVIISPYETRRVSIQEAMKFRDDLNAAIKAAGDLETLIKEVD